MKHLRPFTRFVAPFVAAMALLLAANTAGANVGVVSVVEGEPVGKPTTGTERTLYVGLDMTADEKVTTKDNDRAHLVFLDGTSLTVGPNSNVVIDKFVYDPNTKTGEMALNVSRGTLRFVGGVISKKSEVKITTPLASMGIRGGILTVGVAPNGSTIANFLYGTWFSMTSQGVTRTTDRPGQQITVAPGAPPTPPVPIPPGSFTSYVASFEQSASPQGSRQGAGATSRNPGGRSGTPGGPGNGPATRPTAAIVNALANTGLRRLNSGMTPAAVIAATPTPQQLAALMTAPPVLRGAGPDGTRLAQGGANTGGQQNGQGGLLGPGRPIQGTPDSDNRPNANDDPVQGGGPLQGASPDGDNAQQGNGPVFGRGPLQGGGPLQGSGPLQGAGPLQGEGPLQGAGPLLGAGPLQGAGPLLGAGPLQGAGPLLGAGPLQGAGPLIGAGPLQGATPVLDGGPTTLVGPVNINVGGPPSNSPIQMASLPPTVQLLPQPAVPTDPLPPSPPSPPSPPPPPDPTPPTGGPPPTPDPPAPPAIVIPPTCLSCGPGTPPVNNVVTTLSGN